MELLLWRHAEAVDGEPDAARELTPRGRRQAQAVALWLEARRPKPLRVIVSPAVRTQQTARYFLKHFETDIRVGTDANYEDLLAAAGWPDAGGSVLIVGHQPTLGQAASYLLTGAAADLAFKKGALWWIGSRQRDGTQQTVLKASITAELADGD